MKINLLSFVILLCAGLWSSCKTVRPATSFAEQTAPAAPDYSQSVYWAALPTKTDPADRVPDPSLRNQQAEAEVDIFYLYPTIYSGSKGQDQWNAPVDDPDFNESVDASAILHQASVFNAAGRIYAPRYRQAHLSSYRDKARADDARQAFELAYQDVRRAFQYYLDHFNEGRPFIIASHSQGTTHAKTLIKELIDGQPLQEKLIVAYLVGIPVAKNYFDQLPACRDSLQTQCFCSWRTYRRGAWPQRALQQDSIAVTNPLSWTTDTTYVAASQNKGGVLRKFNKIKPGLTDAQIYGGILWASKPKFFGNFILRTDNYHIGDFNLYYVNIRENAVKRVRKYLENKE